MVVVNSVWDHVPAVCTAHVHYSKKVSRPAQKLGRVQLCRDFLRVLWVLCQWCF